MNIAEEIIRDIPKGLLNWYHFSFGSIVLFIGDSNHSLVETINERGCRVVCVSVMQLADCEWQKNNVAKYDYVVADRILEKDEKPGGLLKTIFQRLKPDGELLLAVNNRLGIRYFCGDRDPYTKRNFDGVEGYRRAYSKTEDLFSGRMYSKAELQTLLKTAGWEKMHFYSILTDIDNPGMLFSENYFPNEDLINRVFPTYNSPDTIFLEEEGLYQSLLDNSMFHQMANAYLIVCSCNEIDVDVLAVTNSLDRGKTEAMQTVIYADKSVSKKNLYPEGEDKIHKLILHGNQLRERGISVVDARIVNDKYIMPFIEHETGQKHLKELLLKDKNEFLKEMDRLRDLVFQTSDVVRDDSGDIQGAVLEKGYLDFVPLNSFYVEGEYVFFDQEFCVDNCPVNVLIWRIIGSFYACDSQVQKILPQKELLERYGIAETVQTWRKMEADFLDHLLNHKQLRIYHEKCRRNMDVVHSNRQRINYSGEEYQKLFIDIFPADESRKIILFGSGNFTKRFLELYGQDYPVYAIVDNNDVSWGEKLNGVTIGSPEMLKELSPTEYKVIVCIKNYLSVVKQLDCMGVTDYSIYDAGKDYPRKRKTLVQTEQSHDEEKIRKKYRVGYIAGVFDLFHIGHLNMFKRAKEQCEYLIVGVVPDERVEKIKSKKPFIPFGERMELVASCRFVDEVVAIPENYGGTRDAWKLYHFDCQFSGSDYADNPDWLADKEFLEKHGSDLVFFPYTEQTSSTKIKELIEKSIL